MKGHSFILLGALLVSAPLQLSADTLYSVTDLGTLGGSTNGVAINAAGQVTGISHTPTGDQHGFLYNNGKMLDLGTLDERFITYLYSPRAINDAGQVTGQAVARSQHAFLYTDGQMLDLNPPRNLVTEAHAINNAGQVTGFSFDLHAFLYSSGQMLDLGTLGGSTSSGVAINAAGQVTGSSDT